MLHFDNSLKKVYTPLNINNTRGVGQDFQVIIEYSHFVRNENESSIVLFLS